MSAHHLEKPKKSFEFRMCKKVAELTQVVHMLFTRNHEKEVEIDALKKSYEREIELVLDDARGKISDLELAMSEVQTRGKVDLERERQLRETEAAAKEADWRQKLTDNERLLQEERTECQNLRDMLINAQRDIEKLRQGVSDQLSSKSDEILRRDKEMEKIKGQLAVAETKLKDAQKEAQAVISELEKGNEKLTSEVRQLHTLMDNSHKTRDQLLTRNKQLEGDMKALKREFNKKVTEMVNNQLRNSKSSLSAEANEELERLRREVQRYRLELSNRDNNFNRMFSEKQPMVVNQRALQRQPSGTIYTFSHGNSQSQQPGSSGPNEENPNGFPTGQTSLQNSLNLRDRHVKNNSADPDRLVGQLERQMTLPERTSTQDRLFKDRRFSENGSARRPMTQGPTFLHERTFTNERHINRHHLSANLLSEEPSQLLPQKSLAITPSDDRPTSSSLPSICSTPEQKRLVKQLSKPKPLPREMLYGK